MTFIRHNKLGATGAVVSELCLSTLNFGWTIRPEEASAFLDRFYAKGGNFLLAAGLCPGMTRPRWTEAPEVCVGRWWRERGMRREDLVFATKLVLASGGRPSGNEIEACLDASLRRIQTDHVDLVIVDPPDAAPSLVEWVEALGRLVDKGKVLQLAAGSVPGWHLAGLAARATGLPAWNALHADYSLLDRSAERLLAGLPFPLPGFVAQSPLAGGFLAEREDRRRNSEIGRRRRDVPPARSGVDAEEIRSALTAVAAECESTRAQVAITWVLSNPAVSSVVLSALSLNQLDDAIGACTLDLSWSQLRRLDLVSSLQAGAPGALVV